MTTPPRHGDRGDAGPPAPKPSGPTVAISRQAGARGGSVGRRVGRLLGWPVYNQDSLDYLVRDDAARAELLTGLPTGAKEWADAQIVRLTAAKKLAAGSETAEMVRLVLALAARGQAVIVGRGAGFVLPAATTVHVRVVAPKADRVAYMGDWLRLPPAEATAEVDLRDRRRARFLAAFGDPADPTEYDLVVNAGRLGEPATAALIVAAVSAKTPTDESDADIFVRS